jgi:UDP-2-acetamido-2,6-beta-L-arabino-hexul-4-ose reductase
LTSAAKVTPLRTVRDARGALFEPLDAPGLAAQRNVHVVVTAPGFTRGNHYHLRGTEVAAIVGPARVRLKENGVCRDVEIPAGEVWQLVIPAGVTHAYQNPGPDPMVIVAFNSEIHDPANGDMVRDEILT